MSEPEVLRAVVTRRIAFPCATTLYPGARIGVAASQGNLLRIVEIHRAFKSLIGSFVSRGEIRLLSPLEALASAVDDRWPEITE